MTKYIYPAGVTGHYLAWVMRFLYRCEIEFIDDCNEATSLEAFAKKNYSKGAIVHLALSTLADNYDSKLANMKQRLEQLGITYEDKSLEWHIQKVCDKIKQEFIGDEKAVVMFFSRGGSVKGLGFVHKELLNRGIKVILICTDMLTYESLKKDNSKKCLVLYWLAPYVKYVDFGEVVLETIHFDYNTPPKNLIYVGHNYGAYNVTDTYAPVFFSGCHVCIADKECLYGEWEKCIPSGYIGFDVMLNKMNSAGGGNSVLVAPYNMEELRLMTPMIQKILTKYKVILRQRYEWLEMSEYMECLKGLRGDLCIDASESFLVSSYQESFCLICGITSTKFTYPLLSGKPVIVLPDIENRVAKDIRREVNNMIGINLDSYENVENRILEILEEIQANAKSWNNKIQKYRDENVYNFGTASQWLADYLVAKYHL